MQWIAQQDERNVFLGGELREPGQVLADVSSLERFEALSGDPELVAEGQSDAPFAEVEGQYPALIHRNFGKLAFARFAVSYDFISS
jgi:hypothetical protein